MRALNGHHSFLRLFARRLAPVSALTVLGQLVASDMCGQERWLPLFESGSERHEIDSASLRSSGALRYVTIRSTQSGRIQVIDAEFDCAAGTSRRRSARIYHREPRTGSVREVSAGPAIERGWIGYPGGSSGAMLIASVCGWGGSQSTGPPSPPPP